MKVFIKNHTTLIAVILVCLIIYNIFSVLIQQKDKYLSRNYWQNFKTLEQSYLDSQYINKHPKAWLKDEVVFSYAGGKLIQGTNPVLIIPDAPPLGKYLIGVSTVLFNNENIITAIFGITSLFFLYLLSRQIFDNILLALLPSVFFSFETAYKNQFIYTPLFDLMQLVYLLLYFYFINKGFMSKKSGIIFFIIASLFLGFFISTKFFISGLTLVGAPIVLAILKKKKEKLLPLLLTIPLSVAVLLLSYARVFSFGYDFKHFLGIQKWVYLYHHSQLILPFSVWPLLLFNQWYVWFGDKPVISDSQWSITWPIVTILSFITIALYVLKKIKHRPEIEVLMLWSLIYLVFLSFGQVFSRYFIILIPILYIISLYGVKFVVSYYMAQKKK